jgi:DNA-binding NtrC family response regulator
VSRFLIVDDDIQMLSALEAALTNRGHEVRTASNGSAAAAELRSFRPRAIITDLRMPTMDGLELLAHVRKTTPELPVILLSAYGTVPTAVQAIQNGATDFLVKPFSQDELDRVIERLPAEHVEPARGKRHMVTQNAGMKTVLDDAAQAARTDATILVEAESGTGKELLARWIHSQSVRKNGPFVAVNCAALPDSLLESELFGYEKGAFTGANTLKPGKFELAQNGTILLDEIGEMAPMLQAKLLRVLQEHEVDRVGGRKPVPISVRVIATTNKNLRKLISKGQFREDLYFRLNVVPLRIPPLRERKDDIEVLADHFARKYGSGGDTTVPAAAVQLLSSYSWPGNVRELENVIHRAFALRGQLKIVPGDLFDQPIGAGDGLELQAGYSVSEMERKLILATLEQTNGNRTHAAKLLGISLRTLRNKLRDYRVEEAKV